MAHSEEHGIHSAQWDSLRDALGSGAQDAQLLVWGPEADMKTAVETIEERCRMAFDGVPNETRKALTDGTTVFERVLPGPDRMYPDTDSAPIPIDEALIEQIRQSLPQPVSACLSQMRDWRIPEDCFTFLLRRNLFPVLEQMVREEALPSTFAGVLLGHRLRHECGDGSGNVQRIVSLVREVRERGLTTDILLPLLPHALASPQSSLDDLLTCVGYSPASEWDVLAKIPVVTAQFSPKPRRNRRHARRDWIMGQLRPMAMGNVAMTKLAQAVAEETADE
jgi:glutamyl-tRNA(Gln) amidotransferase subunit E